ncbi:MAG: nitrilase-related carbon-nitrogen hydrolase [Phycisphaerales bacterium JB039]
MRAHLLQMDIAWEDPSANFAQVEELLDRAGAAPGDLVLLPEMFDTGFSLNTEVTADRDGRTLAFLRNLARQRELLVQGGRTVLAPGEAKATNRAPVFGADGLLLCEYAKIHPFSFGREPERFTGGAEVVTYPWQAGAGALRVCPAICYDLRFPELFRRGLLAGAELFALGANWPDARQSHWRALSIARAIENQAFVLAVNRTGADPHLRYAGGSIAVGPKGAVLGELGAERAALTVEIDPEAVRAWRRQFPAWRDLTLSLPAR